MLTFENLVSKLKSKYFVNQADLTEIISYVSKSQKSALSLLSSEKLSSYLSEIEDILQKMQKGAPLEYLLGYKDFYGLRLNLNSHVLIPRPETEILVDKVLSQVKGRSINTVFDVACGSGAIGLSLKKCIPKSQVYLSDISFEALDIAKNNAASNSLDVEFFQGDLLTPYKGLKADLLVCNPPYISESAFEKLDLSVKDNEPKIALTAKNEGLECYQRLSLEMPKYLNSGALIAFEIGFDQKNPLEKLFSKKPYHSLRFEKDFAGHYRFFFLEIE